MGMRDQATPRTVVRPQAPTRRESPRCQATGCDQGTRERKPFCIEHLEHSSYVAELLRVLQARDDELVRVAQVGSRAVRVEGVTAQEILLQLRLYGKRTTARLSRDLSIKEGLVRCYARVLSRRGYVCLGKTQRNATLLSLRQRHAVSPDAVSEHAA